MNIKITILTALFSISTGYLFAQQTTITGEIKGLGNGQVVIHQGLDGTFKPDTLTANNDRFRWTAAIAEPKQIYMVFPQGYKPLFIEPGNIQLNGDINDLNNIRVTGSKLQQEADAYQTQIANLDTRTNALYMNYGKGNSAEQLAVEMELEGINQQKREKATVYIKEHPNSAFALHLITEQSLMGKYEVVGPMFALLDPQVKSSVAGKKLAERIAILKRSANGEQLLHFTQPDLNGKEVSSDQFKGKYVLIDFWASWCSPCRAENPNVLKAFNTYKSKNFTVVGISLDDKADKWKKAVAEDKLPWMQLSDLKGFKNKVSEYYGVMGIPSNLLIDPDGKIVAKDLRGELLHKKLGQLIQ